MHPHSPYYPGPEGEPQPGWAAAPPPVTPPKKKHTTLIVVAVLVGVMLCVAGSLFIGGLAADNKPNSKATTFVEPSVAPNKGAPAAKPKTTQPAPVTIGDGDWVVGDDVKSGTYKTFGASPSVVSFCTWTVRENDDPGAEIIDYGTSTSTKATGRVKLRNGQSFETRGCKDWIKQ